MKKAVKIVLLSLAALIILVLVVIVVAVQVIDPNDYKTQIAALIEDNTGFKAEFNGPIELQVVPRLAVTVQDVVVASDEGEKGVPLASMHEASLRMALFPLLRGRVEVDSIFLNGVEVNLSKDRDGKANWAAKPHKDATPAPVEDIGGVPVVMDEGSDPLNLQGGIASVQLENCRFNYADAMTGQNYGLDLKRLTLSDVALGQDMQFALSAALEDRAQAVTALLDTSGSVLISPERAEVLVNLGSLNLEGNASKQMVSAVLSLGQGKLAYSIAKQSAQAELLSFSVKGRMQKELLNAEAAFAGGTFRYDPEQGLVAGELSAFEGASASQSLNYDGKAELETLSVTYNLKTMQAQAEFKALDLTGSYEPQGVQAKLTSTGGKAAYGVEKGSLQAELSGLELTGKAAPEDLKANFALAGNASYDSVSNAIALNTTRLKLDGSYDDGDITAQFNTSGSAQLDTKAGNVKLSLPDLSITAKTPHLKKAQALRGNMELAGNPNTLSGKLTFALSGDDLKVSASGSVSNPAKALKADGSFEVKSNPAAMVDLVQIGLRPADADALSRLDASGSFALAAQALKVSSFSMNLDGTPVNGTALVKMPGAKGLPQGVDYDLTADVNAGNVNVDRYLAPQPHQTGDKHDGAGEGDASDGGKVASRGPVQGTALEKMVADVSLKAESVTVSGIKIDAPVIKARADRGTVTLDSANARVFDGSVQASGSAGLASINPPVRIKADVMGVNAEKVLTVVGKGAEYVKGSLDAQTELSFNGLDTETMFSSLNGNGNFALNDGEIRNFQLIPADAPVLLAQLRKPNYPMQKLSGSFTVVNGLITNNDLVLLSPKLNASGEGQVNLAAQNMDYRVRLIVPDRLELPLRAHGPFSNLSYGIDAAAAAQEAAQKTLKDLQDKGKIPTQEKMDQKLQGEQTRVQEKVETKREEMNQKINQEIEKGLGKLLRLPKK